MIFFERKIILIILLILQISNVASDVMPMSNKSALISTSDQCKVIPAGCRINYNYGSEIVICDDFYSSRFEKIMSIQNNKSALTGCFKSYKNYLKLIFPLVSSSSNQQPHISIRPGQQVFLDAFGLGQS